MKKGFALLFTVISTISLNAQVVENVEVEWPRKIESNKNIVSKNKLGKNQIRTATYSILPETTPPPNRLERWANRKTQILHLIKDCNIDIIGTQRAYSRQISQLAKLSGYSVVTNSDSIPHAILYNSSRLKQEACGFLSLTSENRYDQTPHTCTWAKFKETDGGKTFYVFNTYLRTAEEAETLLQQTKKIAGKKPVIITADLFALQYKPAPMVFRGKMKDSYDIALHKTGKVGTYHNFRILKPIRRMDYIFLSPHFIVNEYDTIDEELQTIRPGSDHLPVVVDLTIK